MKTWYRFLATLVLGCVASATVWAQATAQISGIVRDASGGAIGGADIKATQTETGLVRTSTTGPEGAYVLPNLPIGPYTIQVSKTGFATYVQSGIVLQVASEPTVDVTLKVGSVTEQVQVEANAALVETQNTSVGAVIENQRILELPLNGRNATDLVLIAGAAVPQGAASSRSMNGGQAISVAGGQSFGVGYFLDGGLHNNPFDNLNLPLPFPDALQEFKVETSAMTAQNGLHSGAAVNAVTRAGTNDLHASAFEFLRNGVLNGHPYFSNRDDNLKRNQFGGTIGGPLRKNKLFAFGGYQGTKTRSLNPDGQAFIPTDQMLRGDFTACPTATVRQPAGFTLRNGAVINGGRVDPGAFSPAALNINKRLGLTPANACGLVLYGIAQSINEYQVIGRADYNLNEKHTLFGRYMATTFYQATPYSLDPNLLNTTQGGRDNLGQSFTLGDTYLITPTTVNALRLAVNRTAIARINSDFFSAPEVGVQAYSYMPHYMLLNITGGFAIGGGTENLATFRTTTYQIGDDVSLVKGSHQIAFGATYNQWRSAGYANVRSPATYAFSGAATGYGLADFLLGVLNSPTGSFLQSAPNTLIARDNYFGAYVQDTWKASQRLTLNYGVRWEPWFPQNLTNNAIYNFDRALFDKGARSSIFKNAPAGLRFPGDTGFPLQAGMERRWSNLGPRVGLAWDPFGNGKTSIRASYGLSYDFVNGQFFINTANAPPWGSEIRLSGNVPFDTPFNNTQGITNIFPVVFDQNAFFSLSGPFIALKQNTRNTSVHDWNLSLQRQVGSAWLLSVNYLANETEHLWVSTQANPGVYLGTGACTLNGVAFPVCSTAANLQNRRALSLTGNPDAKYIGYMDQFDDGGTQSYHGLLLAAQRRLANRVSANANYTWSHCIGDFTQGGSTPNVGTGFLDPSNRRLDRGNCMADRRHIFNLTVVAEAPRFENRTVRMLAGGWRVSGIYRLASGSPLTVTTTADVQLNGNSGQRPNLVRQNANCATQSISCFLDPAAFQPIAQMPLGTIGNLGRFALVGPAQWQLDMALSRVFRIGEKLNLETRGEAFNVPNSLRSGNPVVNINNTTQFGKVVSTISNPAGATLTVNDSRVVQVAMKLTF